MFQVKAIRATHHTQLEEALATDWEPFAVVSEQGGWDTWVWLRRNRSEYLYPLYEGRSD